MADVLGITTMVGGFITAAILISVGIQILGGAVQDCTGLPGFDTDEATTIAAGPSWSASCFTTGHQTQQAYSLLPIVLVVLAAVAIIVVLRFLSG